MVIWDWDGTLARSLDLWLEGYRRALSRRGLDWEARRIVAEVFHDHHLVPARHPDLDFAVLAEEVRAEVRAAAGRVRLHDGAAKALEGLAAAGVEMALVSSSPRAALEAGLAAHGLGRFFGSVLAGDDGFGHKPDPLPFVETRRRMGWGEAAVLVIGDSHVDILAGRAAGCRTCWFAPEENGLFHDFAHLEGLGADHRIAGLEEVAALIRG